MSHQAGHDAPVAATPLPSVYRAGVQLASAPLKLASTILAAGTRAERATRAALLSAAHTLALDAIDAILTRALDAEIVDVVYEHVEASGIAQHVVQRLLDDRVPERIVEHAIESPELARMLGSAIASPLVEELVTGLLESEQLWLLVDEIARSPSVTEAISHQSRGFVEEVADRARDSSRSADAWVQRIARRRARHAAADRAKPAPPTSLPDGESP